MSIPMIGDVTILSDNTQVLLQCKAILEPLVVSASLIATPAGTITPSS